ncbi:diol dehydratase small subunit [Shinella daejeonensis]|uniref:diol dehydratase small subunit n=1 Tax=Shinella daejeonensis TaxID=659017 RepID=UPI0020C7FB1E|nr:diol dehydratase small subunit [Shinella daejeonensis]MCP8896864.1 diol dehydratase small subunit [Shinella daejeonensis]
MSTDARNLYPLSEKAPHLVRSKTGLGLEDFTVDAVLEGRIVAQDLAITPEALRLQADVARATDRDRLAENFERAAELVAVPQEMLLDTYELLRPGRAKSADQLRERATLMRVDYGATRIAALIEEAADVCERRGLFTKRF